MSDFSTYLDNLIAITHNRFAGHPAVWENVSMAVTSALRHPCVEEERIALRWVDPLLFTPEVCEHRVKYLLWKTKRSQQQQGQLTVSPPGQFNILKESLKSQIDGIMEETRKKLPTISDINLDDGDEGNVEIMHRGPCLTKEQLEFEVARGEAEDDLFQKIQALQLEHYQKYKRWPDAPLMDESKVPDAPRAPVVETAKALESFTVEDVAKLLDELDLSEHKSMFRRTTGSLLTSLTKQDLKDRFKSDVEAADILWVHIGEHKKCEPSSASKLYQTTKAPSQQFKSSSATLQEIENKFAFEAKSFHETMKRGDLSALKRALNPARPPRPSAANDEVVEGDAVHCDPEANPFKVESTKTAVSNSRASRFQIMEYSDSEDDQ